MAIYLGIDGGATKTTCAVSDEGTLLGTGISGGSNIVRLGEEQARASLQAAILKACHSARIDPTAVERTCIGVAGTSAPQVRENIRRFVTEVVSGNVSVVGDNEIALEAAFGGGAGVIVASGTGSIAYGRNEAGKTGRAGGHGFAISDEGSGYWIGRAAVIAVMRASDRGIDTVLHSYVREALAVHTREELVKVANATPSPDFASLFPLVVQAAENGDAVAIEALKKAGTELAQLAGIVIDNLWSVNDANVRVAMTGGVFQNSSIVRQEFYNALRGAHPQVNVSFSVVNAVMGALALARKGLEIKLVTRS